MTSEGGLSDRARSLCWAIGFGIYLVLAAVLYATLSAFPRFHHENSTLIWSVAWAPIGVVAIWCKNRIEDWLLAER